MPHDLAAERCVLGAVLVDSTALPRAQSVLKASDFFRWAHGAIFEAMSQLDAKGTAIDPLTLTAELERVKAATEVGGPAYVAGLTDGVPRAMNVEHYAEIVKEHSVRRALIGYGTRMAKAAYDQSVQTKTLIAEADRAITSLQRGVDGRQFVRTGETVGEEYADLKYRVDHRGELAGVTSGYQTIDKLTNGWQPGEMIVLAARPSIGKTAFALNVACHASAAGKHVTFFSLEMRRKPLQKRMLAHLSGVSLGRILSGYLGESDLAKLSGSRLRYRELNVYINDQGHQTIGDVRTACRQLKSEKQLDLVIVDYVQLMAGSLDRRHGTRNEELAEICRRLKVLADEVSAPVIVLSQLSRAGDARRDKRPILSDLRDTGALEQDADLVCFLHREHHRAGGATQFIIEKQRNGPTGVVNLTLIGETQTFEDSGDERVGHARREQAAAGGPGVDQGAARRNCRNETPSAGGHDDQAAVSGQETQGRAREAKGGIQQTPAADR